MTIRPDRFYLRALVPLKTDWDWYQAGELLRCARDTPRSFLKVERAIAFRRALGLEADIEIRRGCTLNQTGAPR